MKEAIGGSWLFVFVIIFLALFSGFVCLATNYSKCYKTKDDIITILTDYRGINEKSISEINKTLKNVGYRNYGRCPTTSLCYYSFNVSVDNRQVGYSEGINYCIAKTVVSDNYAEGNTYTNNAGVAGHASFSYYSVAVFFGLDIPVFFSDFQITITGETAPMYVAPNSEADYVNNNQCGYR